MNCNPLYTPRELEHQLADSGADAIVILENFAKTLQEVIGKSRVRHVVTTQLGDLLGWPRSTLVNAVVKHVKRLVPSWSLPGSRTFGTALAEGRRHALTEPPLGHDDLAFLQYTGGTTGVSKGAMLTHGNIVSNLQQVSAWIGGEFVDGKELVVTALPLYHIFALSGSCLCNMKIGAHNVLITNPRDMPGFVKELGKYPFSTISGVNTLFNGLMNTAGFAELDFSGLKLSLGGGMAVQRATAERWKQITGIPLLEAYGLTETSPGACINPLVEGFEYNGTAGLPIPSTVVTIRDDDARILPLGETGEICIAGPQVMKGYWNRPDETANVMTTDGALRTGDIGFMNAQGYVKIVDRKKDMILVSGFNVYPNEVEDVVAMMPGVREVRRGGAQCPLGGDRARGDRAQGSEPHEGAGDRALPQGAHRLKQGAAHRGVLERAPEEQRRQGAAARGARHPAQALGCAGATGLGGLLQHRTVLAQRVADPVHRPVDLLTVDDERGCQAGDRAVGVLAQHAVLEQGLYEGARAHALGIQLHADQQPAATHVGHHGAGVGAQALQLVGAHGRRAIGQALLREHRERRQAHRRAQRVAAERAAVVAGAQHAHHFLAGAEGRHRQQPAAQRLAEDDGIGLHVLVLAGEELAGAPQAGLHLVGDEQHVLLAADARALREVALGRHHDARLALYGFHEERRGLRRDGGLERRGVAERHVAEALGGVGAEVVAVLRVSLEKPTMVEVRPWKLPSQTMICARPAGTFFTT